MVTNNGNLAIFYTAADLPCFEFSHIFFFVTQLAWELFRSWFDRVNLSSQNFNA